MSNLTEVRIQLRSWLGLLILSTAMTACTTDVDQTVVISPDRVITHPDLVNIDSVVLDDQGRVYVSDMYSIKVFSDTGELLQVIGDKGTVEGQFSDEVLGLAINSRKQLLAVDKGNHRVQIFDLNGNFIRSYGNQGAGEGEFQDPQGIVVDQFDLAYVTDGQRNDVQVFSPLGEYLYSFGTSTKQRNSLKEPESMVIRNERLYVADEGNGRVQVYAMRGDYLESIPRSGTLIRSKFASDLDDVLPPTDEDILYHRSFEGDIEGIVFDSEGILYLLDEDAGRIVLLQGERQRGAFISELPIASGDGMAVDIAYEDLYVVDQGNSRIQVFGLKNIREQLIH